MAWECIFALKGGMKMSRPLNENDEKHHYSQCRTICINKETGAAWKCRKDVFAHSFGSNCILTNVYLKDWLDNPFAATNVTWSSLRSESRLKSIKISGSRVTMAKLGVVGFMVGVPGGRGSLLPPGLPPDTSSSLLWLKWAGLCGARLGPRPGMLELFSSDIEIWVDKRRLWWMKNPFRSLFGSKNKTTIGLKNEWVSSDTFGKGKSEMDRIEGDTLDCAIGQKEGKKQRMRRSINGDKKKNQFVMESIGPKKEHLIR